MDRLVCEIYERKNRFLIQEEEEEKSEGRKLMDRLVCAIYERKNCFLIHEEEEERKGQEAHGQVSL
jgi:hypothetical protein